MKFLLTARMPLAEGNRLIKSGKLAGTLSLDYGITGAISESALHSSQASRHDGRRGTGV